MTNEFYEPGAGRGARVNDLFTRIAPRYDLINDLQSLGLHRFWKRRVIGLAAARPGDAALDVCCGTGDLAIALAARGAKVVGLDFNQRMLEAARRRTGSLRGGKGSATAQTEFPFLRFVQGDALRIPFPDRSFDIVTIAYGLRNLADLTAGLREIQRVARPGGRVLILDFGKPDNAVWRGLYFAYLRFVVPVLGLVFCGNASAYAYIVESLKHYPAQRGVAARMGELGLEKVRVVNLLGGVMSINYGERHG